MEKPENNIEQKPGNEHIVNIFCCLEKNQDYSIELKQISESSENKFEFKGKFDKISILNEISYYSGVRDANRGQIDVKQIYNIVILCISFNDAKNLLFDFIKKFEKSPIKNDAHPFFIFLPYENNANYNKEQLINEINEFQKNKNSTRKLDSRNISFENKETIPTKIKMIYNYYNEIDEVNQNVNYNKSNMINILTIGRRGSGKSTLINRLLGEKKAYAQKSAKTLSIKEYYHKYYPIKFIDSAGFEIGTLKHIDNITEFLRINFRNIFQKIHFIFYEFKKDDKFDDNELKIIKELYKYNIEIFFVITHITEDDEYSAIDEFEESLKNYHFSEDTIKNIINNTFCLDLLDIKYSDKLSELIDSVYKKIIKYEESNNKILEYINDFNNIPRENNGEIKPLINENSEKEGILTKKVTKNPNDVIESIKDKIKNNIFFVDFETDRKNRKEEALRIVKSYENTGFWLAFIPIPFYNMYLQEKSREEMINELGKIYHIVLRKRIENKTIKYYNDNKFLEIYENAKNFFWRVIESYPFINDKVVRKLGNIVVDEYDNEYAKIGILDKYKDVAEILKSNFNKIKEFCDILKINDWYDITLHNKN